MSEELPEKQVSLQDDEPGENEIGEHEAGEGEPGEGEPGEGVPGEGENETEATASEEIKEADKQGGQRQEHPESEVPSSSVDYTENEVQTDFTFSPTASNTNIAHILLRTLEGKDAAQESIEAEDLDQEKGTEEDADKLTTEQEEGETGTEEAAEIKSKQVVLQQQAEKEQEETEIDDWIKERTMKKPKESRAMWDYSLYAPISMLQEQIAETYEEFGLSMFAKLCEPMWDYDLLASPSMIESQVDETYELKLELSSLKCEPMWDYQLSVSPAQAEGYIYFKEQELRFEVSSLKCHPMWDYDLSAPVQAIPEEIYWVPSYLNFLGVTREKFFQIEETPNSKFIQTLLHFDPDIIIQPEDLLGEPNEEDAEKRKCYAEAQFHSEKVADIVDESDETWYPTYLNMGELKKPYQFIGGQCIVEEADAEIEGEVCDDVVTTEVQTDVGLGELLQSESISSVTDAADLQAETVHKTDEVNEFEERTLLGDAEESGISEESAPVESATEEITSYETLEKGEPDVPWALLSETAIAPQQFLPQDDDILSTVSLAPTAERQENKFNLAVTLDGTQWGFPEYAADDDHTVYSTVLPEIDEEFTWEPDSNKPFESSVFAPISEEDALLLESVQAVDTLHDNISDTYKFSDMMENDEINKGMSKKNEFENEMAYKQRDYSPTHAPVIEVEIAMVPSATGQQSSDSTPQIEVEVAWEALPESLVDGRTPDIIVTTGRN